MKVYSPAALVTVCSVTPVARLSRTTWAPETIPPCGSVTVPLMVPLPACANAEIPVNKITKHAKNHARALPATKPLEFIHSPSAVCAGTVFSCSSQTSRLGFHFEDGTYPARSRREDGY